MDVQGMVDRAQERFAKIRQDPERALFSEYKGVSPSGAVTVWVDMMGKLVRLHIAPNTVYEGAEPWLLEEIMAAHTAAKQAADVLDFAMADLIREISSAPRAPQSPQPPPVRESRPAPADDDDWFEQRSHLR